MADTGYRKVRMMAHWYARLVAQHPYMVALTVLSVVSICTTLALVRHPPDYSILSADLILMSGTEYSKRTSARLSLGYDIINNKNNNMPSSDSVCVFKGVNQSAGRQTLIYQKEVKQVRKQKRIAMTSIVEHDYDWFCEDFTITYKYYPYGPVVYSYRDTEDTASKSLFTLQAVQSMCAVESKYFGSSRFRQICKSSETGDKTRCCRSRSLVNYLMLMYNRSTCNDMQERDIEQALRLLQKCSRYYHAGQLEHNCATRPCHGVPDECSCYNAVYNLLHYILDKRFLPAHNLSQTNLEYVSSYIPVNNDNLLAEYFLSLTPPLGDKLISIRVFGYLSELMLLKQYIISDMRYLITSSIIVIIITHIYTESLIMTTALYMTMLMALAQAYFVYSVILGIYYFPSFNIFAAVIIVAFGIDESLLFSKIWNDCQANEQSDDNHNQVVLNALRHLLPSVLISSLATSIPFFITAASRFQIIASFSIFAGLTSLMNMLIMLTWTPAIAVLSKRFYNTNMFFSKIPHCFQLTVACCKWHRNLSEKICTGMLKSFHRVWIITFGVLAAAAAVVIICYRQETRSNQFPTLESLRLVRLPQSSMPTYVKHIDVFKTAIDPRKMYIVWGVLVTNGETWYKRVVFKNTRPVYDPQFNVSSPESQKWMYEFCQNLNIETSGSATCFMANFRHWMENRSCRDNVTNISHYPCCRESSYHFPYPSSVFQQCAADAIRLDVHNGVIDKETGHLRAFYDQYDIQLETFTEKTITLLIENTQQWMDEWLVSAPPGLRNGWPYMYLMIMIDIFTHLLEEIHLAVYLGVVFAFVVTLIATMDPIISLLAMFNVSCIIVVTIAVLRVISWHQSLSDPMFFTMIIGLSVDFTTHYSIKYRHCSATMDHKDRVLHVLRSVGSPFAVTALITFIIGCCLLPSTVEMLFKIGVFLVVLSVVNWCYSTPFFLSLLSIWGPERSCWNKFGWSRMLQLLKGTAPSPQILLDVILSPHEAAGSSERVSADSCQPIEDISQVTPTEQALPQVEQIQAIVTDNLEQVSVTDKQQLVP